jgi:tetratricopeptide (TPR) repeat protein
VKNKFIQSVIIIISLFVVSLIEFGDAEAQEDIATNDTNALMAKGRALQSSEQNEEAINYYDRLLAIAPNNVSALNNIGLALDDLGKYNESIGYYDKVLAIDPNDVDALINKGTALASFGQYEQAIGYFETVLAIDPNNTLALNYKQLAIDNLIVQSDYSLYDPDNVQAKR